MAEPWFDAKRMPALLEPDAMRKLAQTVTEAGYGRPSGTPSAHHAQTQRKLDCVVDALRPGLPEGFRNGWDIQVANPDNVFADRTATAGAGIIRVAERHVNHPDGPAVTAFVVAHEMAHNVARHANRMWTGRIAKGEGEDDAREILAKTTGAGILDVVDDTGAARIRLDDAVRMRFENEADAGAMHILRDAGLPLNGGVRFFEAAREKYGAGTSPHHAANGVRHARLGVQAELMRARGALARNRAALEDCPEPTAERRETPDTHPKGFGVRGAIRRLTRWLTGRGSDGEKNTAQGAREPSDARQRLGAGTAHQGQMRLSAHPPASLGRPAIAHTRAQAGSAEHGRTHTAVRPERELDFGR